MIRVRRAYALPVPEGSRTVLVDRLWPRGVRETTLKPDAWLKDVAPSSGLRRWFNHEPARWTEFRRRYKRELRGNRRALTPLLVVATAGDVTLLYGAHDVEHNHAIILKEYLEAALARRGAHDR